MAVRESPARNSASSGRKPGGSPPLARISEQERLRFGKLRRAFLDSMPVALGLMHVYDDVAWLIDANSLFRSAFRNVGDCGLGVVSELTMDCFPLAENLRDFMASVDQEREFAWTEGQIIGGRHYAVRFAKVPSEEYGTAVALIILIDRTAQIETERSLRSEMLHDSLTGLPNRLAFGEAVDQAIEASGEGFEGFAVLVVDLTRFSRINECMGPLAGDELIITVARRLVSALRGGDVLARMGGDEFGILLKLVDGPGDALHAARRIQTALSTPFRLTDLEIRVDCAIGCALMSDRIGMGEDLVRNAQFAMKRAKHTRRIEVYQPGEVLAARQRFSLETELRRAIDQQQLSLAYQPLIDLDTGRVAGFEALCRWHHQHSGMIMPSEFIPVAEESGLILPLGRWAISHAVRQIAQWSSQCALASDVYVAVNVSPVQIQRDDMVGVVKAALDETRIPGHQLKLEITESCIIADPERATHVLRALKDLHVRIAMDDFGTGYSNLAYLQRLPIDTLKIDRSFVTPMLGDRDSLAIVRAVLSLADALGMRTTAEGVETADLAQTLAALGCSLGQGYHYAEPLTPDRAIGYLRSRNS